MVNFSDTKCLCVSYFSCIWNIFSWYRIKILLFKLFALWLEYIQYLCFLRFTTYCTCTSLFWRYTTYMYIPVFEVPQPERLMAPVDCKHGLHSIHKSFQTLLQERNLICQCNIFNDLKVIPTLCIYLSEKKSLKITVKQNLIRNELLSLGIEIFQLKGACKFFNCFSKILINKRFSFLAIK